MMPPLALDDSPLFNPLRLMLAAQRLPAALRERQAAYLASRLNVDGGFAGRQGASDPYYTSFGLRGLALLGQLTEPQVERMGQFGRACVERALPLADFLALATTAVVVEALTGVDFFAVAGSDRQTAFRQRIAPFHRPDGGYAKTERGASSTYATFLVMLAEYFLGLPPADPERTAAFILGRRREDGGFVEAAPLRHGGTNPTAAAVAVLRLTGGLEETVCVEAARFLAARQTPEGGLAAHARLPLSDLLSTFTGLSALAELGRIDRVDLTAVRRFAASLECPAGGFRAGAWDDAVDVEYAFYGLGTLALIALHEE